MGFVVELLKLIKINFWFGLIALNPISISFTSNYMSYLSIFCKQLQNKERFVGSPDHMAGHMVVMLTQAQCKVGVSHP